MQLPPWHASPIVQASPSVHVVPLTFAGFEHAPVDGLHVPASWHWSSAVHATGAPGTQVPVWHASPTVQASSSLQAVPLGFAGFEHAPVAGLHVPGS